MEHDIRALTARLIAQRWLPRKDPMVRRALIDETFRHEIDQRLASVGLRLLDNPYAAHVAVGLTPDALEPTFGSGREYQASNMGLTRDEIALLVVLWALIILPKRERQQARAASANGDDQNDMFGRDRPVPTAASVSPLVPYRALLADFGVQLGKKTRLDTNLKRLENHGFIVRKGEDIGEGPLLDLLLDYDALAPRILQGALADVLVQAKELQTNLPLALTNPEPEEGEEEFVDEAGEDQQG